MAKRHYLFVSLGVALGGLVLGGITVYGHGTAVSPQSRVYKVYKSNPENPDFELAQNAVEMDGRVLTTLGIKFREIYLMRLIVVCLKDLTIRRGFQMVNWPVEEGWILMSFRGLPTVGSTR